MIQAGQSSRPPRWQQCAAESVLNASCDGQQRRGLVVWISDSSSSSSSSRSHRFAALFRYSPSDNAPSFRRGLTKSTERRRRRAHRRSVSSDPLVDGCPPRDASRASRPRRSRDRRALLGVAGGAAEKRSTGNVVRACLS